MTEPSSTFAQVTDPSLTLEVAEPYLTFDKVIEPSFDEETEFLDGRDVRPLGRHMPKPLDDDADTLHAHPSALDDAAPGVAASARAGLRGTLVAPATCARRSALVTPVLALAIACMHAADAALSAVGKGAVEKGRWKAACGRGLKKGLWKGLWTLEALAIAPVRAWSSEELRCNQGNRQHNQKP